VPNPGGQGFQKLGRSGARRRSLPEEQIREADREHERFKSFPVHEGRERSIASLPSNIELQSITPGIFNFPIKERHKNEKELSGLRGARAKLPSPETHGVSAGVRLPQIASGAVKVRQRRSSQPNI